jgi:iron complex outermembrane receptor protein
VLRKGGGAAAIFIAALLAVDANAADDALESIVVTGSRIARSDFDSPSPIVTVPEQMFLQTGADTVERTLNEYPQFVPNATSTSNQPSSDGQATLSLRGLGAQRTLVLLNGRRLLPGDGTGAIDLNIVPPTLIESVEVVTGGASAIYGSDAIAGVVNLKLTNRFEGVRVDGSWTQTGQGDGGEYLAGITAGTSFDDARGSVTAYVGYSQRQQINQDARGFSRYPLKYYPDLTDGRGPGGAFLGSGSDITDAGLNIVFANPAVFRNLFASYGYAPGSVPYTAGLIPNADGTVFTIGVGTPGSVANYRGEKDPVMYNDRDFGVYNAAAYTALQLPLERTTAYVAGQHSLTGAADAYLQALYTSYTADRQLAPAAAGIALIPATNPYIPADLKALLDSRVDPAAPFRYFRRATEVGPQTAENDRDVWQLVAGVRGELTGEWRFDGYVQYGENNRTERQTNNVRLSRLEDLTFAPDGGETFCSGGFNPFVAGSLSQDCARYIAADAANHVTLQQTIAEISVNGPLTSLPAGDLRAALGLFYQRNEFRYSADPTLSAMLPGVPGVIGPRPDIAGFAAAPDRQGQESNRDAYLELRVPVLAGGLGAQSLEIGLGYRYSDYTQAGAVSSFRGELLYRPVAPLLLRGSYAHAVRAPSIEELYYPPVASQFNIPMPDPCSVSSPQRNGAHQQQVEALCLAQGLPAALLPTYQYSLRKVDGVSGGNPDLKAEQANTYTTGLVFTHNFSEPGLHDLQVSIDWYHITINDGIGQWDSESAVARCYDPAYNPKFQPGNIYCTFFERSADTGEIHALILDRNIGGIETAGVDVQASWRVDAGPGQLGVDGYLTYVDKWQYRDPSGGSIEYAGTIGGGLGHSLPRWKSLLNLDYQFGPLTLFSTWRYVDGMHDATYREFAVPARNYFDLGVGYATDSGSLRGLNVRVGVENLFDENPPIYPSYEQANTDPSQYDVLGRRCYLRMQYRFQ